MRLAREPRVELRYMVEFSAEETARMREIGHLPPDPNGVEPEAMLWLNLEELKQMPTVDPIFTQASCYALFSSAKAFTIPHELEELIVRAHNRRPVA